MIDIDETKLTLGNLLIAYRIHAEMSVLFQDYCAKHDVAKFGQNIFKAVLTECDVLREQVARMERQIALGRPGRPLRHGKRCDGCAVV